MRTPAGWPGLPCAGHSWSQLTPTPRAQLSCKFINKIYFININPQPEWSCLRDSWIKGEQHCLVVKGKKMRNSFESPKHRDRESRRCRNSSVTPGASLGGTNIPWQLWTDHSRVNPPMASMEGPHRNISVPAALGRVPCWVKRKV